MSEETARLIRQCNEAFFRPRPTLTRDQIEELLKKGTKSAAELDKQLERVFTPTASQLARRLK
jgi:hypothetical protein